MPVPDAVTGEHEIPYTADRRREMGNEITLRLSDLSVEEIAQRVVQRLLETARAGGLNEFVPPQTYAAPGPAPAPPAPSTTPASTPPVQPAAPAETAYEPPDPWGAPAGGTAAPPPQPAQPAQPPYTPPASSAPPVSPPSPPASSAPVTQVKTMNDGRQVTVTWNPPGGPLCQCGQPAVLAKGASANGKPYSRFCCAKVYADDWGGKCDFNQFTGGKR